MLRALQRDAEGLGEALDDPAITIYEGVAIRASEGKEDTIRICVCGREYHLLLDVWLNDATCRVSLR